MKSPIIAQTWSLRKSFLRGLGPAIKSLKNLGVQSVETAGLGHEPGLIARALSDEGIQVFGMHVPTPPIRPDSARAPAHNERLARYIEHVIVDAKILGATRLTIMKDRRIRNQQCDRFFESVSTVIEHLTREGISLFFHPWDSDFLLESPECINYPKDTIRPPGEAGLAVRDKIEEDFIRARIDGGFVTRLCSEVPQVNLEIDLFFIGVAAVKIAAALCNYESSKYSNDETVLDEIRRKFPSTHLKYYYSLAAKFSDRIGAIHVNGFGQPSVNRRLEAGLKQTYLTADFVKMVAPLLRLLRKEGNPAPALILEHDAKCYAQKDSFDDLVKCEAFLLQQSLSVSPRAPFKVLIEEYDCS
jgi:hypothetical protein